MVGLLKSLFRRGRDYRSEGVPWEVIRDLDLDAILPIVERDGTKLPVQAMHLCRRLYQIAFFAHRITESRRDEAYQAAKSLFIEIRRDLPSREVEDLEAILAHDLDSRPRSGFGSLKWLIIEDEIPHHAVFDFAARPQNSHLVPGYLENFEPRERAGLRPYFLRAIIRARGNGSGGAVPILHGLVAARDPATEALLEPAELDRLRHAHRDYEAARAVLVRVGLLGAGRGRDFQPRPTDEAIAELCRTLLSEDWQESGPSPEGEMGLRDEARWKAVRMAKLVLGMHIALAQISSLYGAPAAEALRHRMMRILPETDPDVLEDLLGLAQRCEAVAYQRPNAPPDAILYNFILDPGLDDDDGAETVDEEMLDACKAAARVLTRARTRYLEQLRLRLWTTIIGDAAADEYLLRERVLEPGA